MTTTAADEDDPVVASYEVYIAGQDHVSPTNEQPTLNRKTYLLQYPSHRPRSRPYAKATSQKPTAFRLKPQNGLVEVDIPFVTNGHYNTENGVAYRKALSQSRVLSEGGSHGLAGGFNAGPSQSVAFDLRDIPPENEVDDYEQDLETQTLGGKIIPPSSGDPVYMLGSIRGNEIHLSHLDAVIQVRPQLHHIDAQEELSQRRTASTLSKNKLPTGIGSIPAEQAPKPESKAIDIKLKDKNEDSKDRNLNANARILHNIQKEPWQVYEWIDQDDPDAHHKFYETLHYPLVPTASGQIEEHNKADTDEVGGFSHANTIKLRSAITNTEWLDKMSAPRETGHGKRGLLAKLRGRERERMRRKKTDEERKRRAVEGGEVDVHGGARKAAGAGKPKKRTTTSAAGGAPSTSLIEMDSASESDSSISSSDLSSVSDAGASEVASDVEEEEDGDDDDDDVMEIDTITSTKRTTRSKGAREVKAARK